MVRCVSVSQVSHRYVTSMRLFEKSTGSRAISRIATLHPGQRTIPLASPCRVAFTTSPPHHAHRLTQLHDFSRAFEWRDEPASATAWPLSSTVARYRLMVPMPHVAPGHSGSEHQFGSDRSRTGHGAGTVNPLHMTRNGRCVRSAAVGRQRRGAGGPNVRRIKSVLRPCRPVRGTPLLAQQPCARHFFGNCPIRVDSRFCRAHPYTDKSRRCHPRSTLEGRTELGRPFERRSPRSGSNTSQGRPLSACWPPARSEHLPL